MKIGAKELAIGGGILAVAATGYGAFVFTELGTGLPNLDALRIPLIVSLTKSGLIAIEHGRNMMALFHMENGNPAKPNHDIQDPMIPGDTDKDKYPYGASVGPGKVLRKTAIQLGLWPAKGSLQDQIDDDQDYADYLAFGQDPANFRKLIDWSVAVYKSKLSIAAGDTQKAIELYNGSGPAAQKYREGAIAFLTYHWTESVA